MGFRVTLLSVPLQFSEAILQSLGLMPGDEADAMNESPFSGAKNGDCYLIWVNDDWYMMTDEELLAASRYGDVLMLRANETVMISEAAEFRNGEKLWSIVHDCNEGPDHLAPTGNPPATWEKIREDLLAEAAAAGDDEVDFAYDAPVVLFKNLTGFRYDEVHELPFVTLQGEHAAKAKKPFWKFWS